MSLTAAEKLNIMEPFKGSEKDVGSTPVQVALLTARIKQLTGHLQKNRNDLHSQRGLMKMVGQRRRHLTYLKRVAPGVYQQILKSLQLRG